MNKIENKQTSLSHIDLVDENGTIISNNKQRGARLKRVYVYAENGVLLLTFPSIVEASSYVESGLSTMRVWCRFGLFKRNLYWCYHFPYNPDRTDYKEYINGFKRKKRKKK